MFRVNYYAEKFGFVGWECFNEKDESVLRPCVQIACSQMSRMIDEPIWFHLIKV